MKLKKDRYSLLDIRIVKYLTNNDGICSFEQICKELYYYEEVDNSFIKSLTEHLYRLNKKIERVLKVKIILSRKYKCIILLNLDI